MFRIFTAALLILFVAHRGYYNRKYRPSETETIEKQEKSKESTLAAIFAVLALLATVSYLLAPNLVSWASIPFPLGMRWIGIGLAAIGFALLEWSHRALSVNWSDQPRITEQQQLVESGPYRWIRHPMYTAFLLILGSTLFISANGLVGISWIAMVGLDAVSRIRYEERALQDRFGEEYQSYKRRTGRILPKV